MRVAFLANIVERADVGVRQLRDRARLAVEALTELRIACQGLGQDLDRDDAIEPRVARSVDFAL